MVLVTGIKHKLIQSCFSGCMLELICGNLLKHLFGNTYFIPKYVTNWYSKWVLPGMFSCMIYALQGKVDTNRKILIQIPACVFLDIYFNFSGSCFFFFFHFVKQLSVISVFILLFLYGLALSSSQELTLLWLFQEYGFIRFTLLMSGNFEVLFKINLTHCFVMYEHSST